MAKGGWCKYIDAEPQSKTHPDNHDKIDETLKESNRKLGQALPLPQKCAGTLTTQFHQNEDFASIGGSRCRCG